MAPDAMNNFLKQVLSLWIRPAIAERKKSGELPNDFKLKAAQVVFSWGVSPEIRLNKQVKAVIYVKPKRNVEKGEILLWSDVDLEDISGPELDDNEKDLGHVTLIVRPDKKILISFNFLYGEANAKKFYEIGKEFLLVAQHAFAEKIYRSMIENLSVAAENFARAMMYMVPDEEVRKTKKHKGIQSRVNIHYRSTGIFKANHKDAYNMLMDLRDDARYSKSFFISDLVARQLLEAIGSLEVEMPPMFRGEKLSFKQLRK